MPSSRHRKHPRIGSRSWPNGLMFIVAAGVIAVVAVALRLHCLGCRSLWLDEVLTAQTIRYVHLSDAVGWIHIWVDHTPFAWLVTWFLRGLGGSEAAIRWPYAAASIVTVPAIFWVGTLFGGRLLGLTAAAFLAVSPFSVFYAQEARPYTWLMLFVTVAVGLAYRAAVDGRLRDWLALAGTVALALYTGYLALLLMVVVYGFAAVVVIHRIGAGRSASEAPRASRWKLAAWAFVSLSLTAVLFVPWLPRLQAFLGRDDLSLNRFVADGGTGSLESALTLLRTLDFAGVLLVLLCIGLIGSFWQLFTRNWRSATLALMWFLVPIAGFVIRFGPGATSVWERYWSIVHPAAVLLTAMGVVWTVSVSSGILRWFFQQRAAASVAHAWERFGRRVTQAIGVAAITALALAQLIPSTLATYNRVKGDDYRGAAELIAAEGGQRPLVVTAGTNADWLTFGLDYYLWLLGVEARVGQPATLDGRVLALEPTSAWLAAYPHSNDIPASAGTIRTHSFVGFHLFRMSETSTRKFDEVSDLLSWAAQFAPAAGDALHNLLRLRSDANLGPSLLPEIEPDVWLLGPGVRASGYDDIELRPSGGEINATFSTSGLSTGTAHVLKFVCLSHDLSGAMHVFVTAHDRSGSIVRTYPDGAGYPCREETDSRGQAFAFVLPPETASATLWFRARGTGVATFEDIDLRADLGSSVDGG